MSFLNGALGAIWKNLWNFEIYFFILKFFSLKMFSIEKLIALGSHCISLYREEWQNDSTQTIDLHLYKIA